MITSERFEFFPGSRRKVELLDYNPLANGQSEKRFRFDFLMPLTGQNMIGLPNFVSPAYERMDMENSAIGEIDLERELEGVTIEAFSTDEGQFPILIDTLGLDLKDEDKQLGRRHVLITAATLRAFKLVRVTREKQSLVALKFSVTMKADMGLACFAHTYQGATFWCTFTETQKEIPTKSDDGQRMALTTSTAAGFKSEVEKIVETANAMGKPKRKKLEDCQFAQGGERCVLEAEHEGDHNMAAPVDLTPRQKTTNRELAKVGVN